MSTDHHPSILFLEKVFTRRMHGPVRGVELFNFRLIRDLLELGHQVSVPVHPDWTDAFDDFFMGEGPELIPLPPLGHNTLSVWMLFFQLRRRHWDKLILANVAKALTPALRSLYKRKQVASGVLIAHREAGDSFIDLVKELGISTTAVNEVIAEAFRKAGCERAEVYYGIMDGDRYHPAEEKASSETIHFCVLGALDNAWKGSDTAMDAFALLPADLQATCRLHLASFSTPISSPHPSVIIHPWMDAERIPELLRTMDVQIVPSRDEEVMRETFSQVMVQGMLTALPQIANDLPILTEKLDAGGGLIFNSVKELAQHMHTLAQDPSLRTKLGNEARATALQRYVWDTQTWAESWL